MVSSTSKTSPYLLKFLDFKWLIAFFRLHQNEESPKILPFYKEIRQPEGSSFSLTCNAIRGSSPSSDSLKFIWHRNSNEIIESSRHNIETKGSLSYFTLSRLTSDDWGNYSCTVFNRNGFDSQWTILRVDGQFVVFFLFGSYLFYLFAIFTLSYNSIDHLSMTFYLLSHQ